MVFKVLKGAGTVWGGSKIFIFSYLEQCAMDNKHEDTCITFVAA